MNNFSSLKNFRQASPALFTCGQPSEIHLALFRDKGVAVVINLALHDDPSYSLDDERAVVRSLGMVYIHIPIAFDHPTQKELSQFFAAMQENDSQNILVHCAANMRVTAFLGLYWHLVKGWPREKAFGLMESVWNPDITWSSFIQESILGFEKQKTAS